MKDNKDNFEAESTCRTSSINSASAESSKIPRRPAAFDLREQLLADRARLAVPWTGWARR